MNSKIDKDYKDGNFIHCGIIDQLSGKTVATCGYYRGFNKGEGELGGVLLPQYQGQGFMTAAMQLAIGFKIVRCNHLPQHPNSKPLGNTNRQKQQMTITKFKNLIFSLLFASIFVTSCYGQTITEQQKEIVVEQLSFTSKNSKLTKTQGTTEHQNVHCSLQDKNGNLWFGTTGEGVYRYNGKEFTQFTVQDGLSSNKIWSILEDKLGQIWFGTDDGLSRFDGKTISQIQFTITNSYGLRITQTRSNAVWSMFQDKDGIIWLGTSQDLFCYDGKSFSRFLDRNSVSNNQNLQLKEIQCILQDSSGTIWMGSGAIAQEGLIRFDGKSITNSKPNGDGWIRCILKDKNENIWFGGRNNGNFIYNGKDFTKFTEKGGIGNPYLVDKAGDIWFNGKEKPSTVENEGGIWRYNGKTFKNYNTSDGISKYNVWSMLEDRKGNIWIGTRNCGLYRYNRQTFEAFSE